MDSFPFGFIVGLIVGLALALIVARLGQSVRWLSSLFGRDPMLKKLRETEKRLREVESEAADGKKRLEEKDEFIRKAMASMADDAQSLPDSDSGE
jgi:gas vesicle protein